MNGIEATRAESVGLAWPVKESFARYVSGTGAGHVDLSGGARIDAVSDLVFPLREAVPGPGANEVSLYFDGTIRFVGHWGALDVSLVEPRLMISGSQGVLEVRTAGAHTRLGSFDCRHQSEPEGTEVWSSDAVILDETAVEYFGGFYLPGTLFDGFVASISGNRVLQ